MVWTALHCCMKIADDEGVATLGTVRLVAAAVVARGYSAGRCPPRGNGHAVAVHAAAVVVDGHVHADEGVHAH